MKRTSIKTLSLLLCLLSMTFFGCSKSNVKNLDLSFYLASSGSGSFYAAGKNARTIKLNEIYTERLNYELVDEYYSISFNSNKSYLYKMYIDYIEITIFTNETLDMQMDVSLSITNLAERENLRDYGTYKTEISLYPKANESKTFKVAVNKVVALATPIKFTFDVSTSTDVISAKNGEPNEFKWFVYGLKIFGENVVNN